MLHWCEERSLAKAIKLVRKRQRNHRFAKRVRPWEIGVASFLVDLRHEMFGERVGHIVGKLALAAVPVYLAYTWALADGKIEDGYREIGKVVTVYFLAGVVAFTSRKVRRDDVRSQKFQAAFGEAIFRLRQQIAVCERYRSDRSDSRLRREDFRMLREATKRAARPLGG